MAILAAASCLFLKQGFQGTSMDAVDTALVDLQEESLQVVAYRQYPIHKDLQQQLRAADSTTPLDRISKLAIIVAEHFAAAQVQPAGAAARPMGRFSRSALGVITPACG